MPYSAASSSIDFRSEKLIAGLCLLFPLASSLAVGLDFPCCPTFGPRLFATVVFAMEPSFRGGHQPECKPPRAR